MNFTPAHRRCWCFATRPPQINQPTQPSTITPASTNNPAPVTPAHRQNLCILTLLLITATAIAQPDNTPAYHCGKSLFQTNCSPCHDVHHEVIGPTLASITKKKDSLWVRRFIYNSQRIIAAGDDYAQHLFEQYNRQVMPAFEFLTTAEVDDILQYIQTESLNEWQPDPEELEPLADVNPSSLRGRLIFQNQCSSCHELYYEDEDGGPALASVAKRHPRPWLIAFIHNSQHVINSGDPYARQLYQAFHGRIMVPMEFLTRQDINDVLTYITAMSASTRYAPQSTLNTRLTPAQPAQNHESVYSAAQTTSWPGKTPSTIALITIATTALTIFAYLIIKLFRHITNTS